MKTATLSIHGDTLSVRWNGSVWQAPSNGTQHFSRRAAMREEIEAYLSASGENVEDIDAKIEEILCGLSTSS